MLSTLQNTRFGSHQHTQYLAPNTKPPRPAKQKEIDGFLSTVPTGKNRDFGRGHQFQNSQGDTLTMPDDVSISYNQARLYRANADQVTISQMARSAKNAPPGQASSPTFIDISPQNLGEVFINGVSVTITGPRYNPKIRFTLSPQKDNQQITIMRRDKKSIKATLRAGTEKGSKTPFVANLDIRG